MDLSSLSDGDFKKIYQVWLDYGVLRFRNQNLDGDGLQLFSQRFAPREEMPLGRMPEELKKKIKNSYVTVISNIIENGTPICGLGNAEASYTRNSADDRSQIVFDEDIQGKTDRFVLVFEK